ARVHRRVPVPRPPSEPPHDLRLQLRRPVERAFILIELHRRDLDGTRRRCRTPYAVGSQPADLLSRPHRRTTCVDLPHPSTTAMTCAGNPSYVPRCSITGRT